MKRGNTAAASTYVGPLGELLVDTGLQTLRLQDGATPGGMSTLVNSQQLSNVIVAIEGIQSNTANISAILANIHGANISGLTSNVAVLQQQLSANGIATIGGLLVGNIGFESNSYIWSVEDSQIQFSANGYNDQSGIFLNNQNLAVLYANTELQLIAGSTSSGETWTFDQYGNLTLPGNVIFNDSTVQSTAWPGYVSSLVDGSQTLYLAANGTVTMPDGLTYNNATFQSLPGQSIYLQNSTGHQTVGINDVFVAITANGHSWAFNSDSGLIFPDHTFQYSAYQGPAGQTSFATVANVTAANSYNQTYTTNSISTAINNLINSAPGTLDTLGQIAANLATEAGAIGGIISSITATNANITAANVAWQANAATQLSQINAANAAIVTANSAVVAYVNAQDSAINTAWSANLTAANIAWTANAVAQQNLIATLQTQVYANANVAAYLPTYTGSLINSSSIQTINSEITGIYSNNAGLYNSILGANVNIATLQTQVYANANASAYLTSFLPTYAGNLTAGNLVVSGNINYVGNVNSINISTGVFTGNSSGFGALYAGILSGYTYQAQTVLQNSTNFNGYAQVNHQNINNGATASTDYVATADTGTAGAGYIDMGINSSGFVNGTGNELNYPLDGYLYAQGTTGTNGNLILGTGGTADIVFTTGGFSTTNNYQGRFKNNVGLILAQTTQSTSTTSGALQVAGGVGIAGNVNIGGNLLVNGTNITLANTIQSNQISAISANIGSFYTYANLNYGTSSYANANVSAYLLGNISTGNIGIPSGGWIDFRNSDTNWRMGYGINAYSKTTAITSLDVVVGSGTGGPDGFTVGQTGGASIFELVGSTRNAWFANNITAVGNVSSGNVLATGFFYANGTPFTSSSYGNTQVAAYIGATSFSSISTALINNVGQINGTAIYLQTNGSHNFYFDSTGNLVLPSGGAINYSNGVSILTGIGGTYSNTNVSAYLTSATINTTGNITAGNLTTSGTYTVANITTTGAYGNITGANVISANTVQVSTGIFWANGVAWSSSGGGTTYSNTNVSAYLTANPITSIVNGGSSVSIPSSGGNATIQIGGVQLATLSQAQINVVGNVVATANIQATNIIGTNYGNSIGTTATYSGNISASYFVGNGSALTGLTYNNIGNIYGSSSNVTLQAGSYSWTFDNTGNLTIPTTGNIVYANGAIFTSGTGSGGAGTTYSNANVVSMLSANTSVFIGNTGNVATVYPLQSNITQLFIGGNTTLTSGNAAAPNSTFLMYNGYFAANGAIVARNTTTGLGYMVIDSTGIAFNGYTGAVTANTVPTFNQFLKMNGSIGAQFSGAVTAVGLTSTSTVAVNAATGITTSQTSIPIVNTTATSVQFAGAATTTTIGASNGITVFGANTGAISAGTIIVNTNFITNGNVTANAGGSIVSTGNSYTTGNTYTQYLVTTGNSMGNITGVNNLTAVTIQTTGTYGNITGANVISANTFVASGNITAANIVANQYGNSIGTTATYSGNVTASSVIASGSSGPQTRFLWDTWQANSNVALSAFTPSGTVGANATWDSTQAYGLKLTPATTSQNGYINWNSSTVNYNYDMVITASIGAGNGTGADGQWIYFGANAVPQSNPGANASNGGIAVFNHYYSSASQFEVYVAGTQTNIPYIGNGNYVTSGVTLWNASYNSFYNLTLKIRKIQNGNRMLEIYLNEAYQGSVNISNWTPAGNNFGVAAYTGGSTANNWVRQLRIDW